jgi:hypothetical protein
MFQIDPCKKLKEYCRPTPYKLTDDQLQNMYIINNKNDWIAIHEMFLPEINEMKQKLSH